MDKSAIANLLINSLSPENDTRQACQKELSRLETLSGFSTALFEIFLAENLDLTVRRLAIILVKNVISRNWKSSQTLTTEEKTHLKNQIIYLLPFLENIPFFDLYIEFCTKVSRSEFPLHWPELLNSIIHVISTKKSLLESGCIIRLLHQIIKTQINKKLMMHKAQTHQFAPPLLTALLPLWESTNSNVKGILTGTMPSSENKAIATKETLITRYFDGVVFFLLCHGFADFYAYPMGSKIVEHLHNKTEVIARSVVTFPGLASIPCVRSLVKCHLKWSMNLFKQSPFSLVDAHAGRVLHFYLELMRSFSYIAQKEMNGDEGSSPLLREGQEVRGVNDIVPDDVAQYPCRVVSTLLCRPLIHKKYLDPDYPLASAIPIENEKLREVAALVRQQFGSGLEQLGGLAGVCLRTAESSLLLSWKDVNILTEVPDESPERALTREAGEGIIKKSCELVNDNSIFLLVKDRIQSLFATPASNRRALLHQEATLALATQCVGALCVSSTFEEWIYPLVSLIQQHQSSILHLRVADFVAAWAALRKIQTDTGISGAIEILNHLISSKHIAVRMSTINAITTLHARSEEHQGWALIRSNVIRQCFDSLNCDQPADNLWRCLNLLTTLLKEELTESDGTMDSSSGSPQESKEIELKTTMVNLEHYKILLDIWNGNANSLLVRNSLLDMMKQLLLMSDFSRSDCVSLNIHLGSVCCHMLNTILMQFPNVTFYTGVEEKDETKLREICQSYVTDLYQKDNLLKKVAEPFFNTSQLLYDSNIAPPLFSLEGGSMQNQITSEDEDENYDESQFEKIQQLDNGIVLFLFLLRVSTPELFPQYHQLIPAIFQICHSNMLSDSIMENVLSLLVELDGIGEESPEVRETLMTTQFYENTIYLLVRLLNTDNGCVARGVWEKALRLLLSLMSIPNQCQSSSILFDGLNPLLRDMTMAYYQLTQSKTLKERVHRLAMPFILFFFKNDNIHINGDKNFPFSLYHLMSLMVIWIFDDSDSLLKHLTHFNKTEADVIRLFFHYSTKFYDNQFFYTILSVILHMANIGMSQSVDRTFIDFLSPIVKELVKNSNHFLPLRTTSHQNYQLHQFFHNSSTIVVRSVRAIKILKQKLIPSNMRIGFLIYQNLKTHPNHQMTKLDEQQNSHLCQSILLNLHQLVVLAQIPFDAIAPTIYTQTIHQLQS